MVEVTFTLPAWSRFPCSNPYSLWEKEPNWDNSTNICKVSEQQKVGQDWRLMIGWLLLFKMYARLKFNGSSPNSFWENNLNAKLKKNLQCKWTVKSWSRLSFDGSFELHSSICTHGQSFMSPVIRFWENDHNAKTRQEFTPPLTTTTE